MIFRALKTEGGGVKIAPETTSDSIFLYHIKMQVSAPKVSHHFGEVSKYYDPI